MHFCLQFLIFLILKITDALQDENFSLLRVVTIISAIYLFTPGFASVFIWRAGSWKLHGYNDYIY